MNATFTKVRNKVRERRNIQEEARVLALAQGNSEAELIELAASAILALLEQSRASREDEYKRARLARAVKLAEGQAVNVGLRAGS